MSDATRSPTRPLMSAYHLAELLGMTRRWVYAQVEENGLPAYKLGRSLMFDPVAVERWLRKRRIGDWAESCADTGAVVDFE